MDFDLVLTEESALTQVANSSSGYHQWTLPLQVKRGPNGGQGRVERVPDGTVRTSGI